MQRQYYAYILTNRTRTVLYIGVTNSLERRIFEHKQGKIDGFTKTYKTNILVFFEETDDMTAAIAREKQIKKWSRQKKEKLIEMMNPDWRDLSDGWFEGL